MGSSQESSRIGRPIQWNGLRAAIDAVADNELVTTEEAFTLLVRFGQTTPHSETLESFARIAEERMVNSSTLFPGGFLIPAAGSNLDEISADKAVTGRTAAKPKIFENIVDGQGQSDDDRSGYAEVVPQSEAFSVMLKPSEIAALAAELDPLRRVGQAFTALEIVLSSGTSTNKHRRRYLSPLHSYAVARRYRKWHDELDAAGNSLASAQHKIGRRGQDLLLTEYQRFSSVVALPPALTAAELIAESKAVNATAAQRQTTSNINGVCGRARVVLSAQVHVYAPLPDRSTRGVRAFDGWGYYNYVAVSKKHKSSTGDLESGLSDDKYAGEAVAVLEISNTEHAGGATFCDNMALMASLLSVPSLRDHPGLVKFHPGARVVLDEKRSVSHEGGDITAGEAPPLRIVCERLKGWRSLSDVLLEHGPLVSPSDIAAGKCGGLCVLRLWGMQLMAVLECLGSRSLVLRDLRVSTVFVSPDGSTLKVAGFSSLATLTSDGKISPEAHTLDQNIHGSSNAITPPEALTRKIRGAGALDSQFSTTLVLASSKQSGIFPATAAWDVWTLGILLYELAFGHAPPAYGDSLGRAVAAATEMAIAKRTPLPKLDELARTIHYDFFSSIGGRAPSVEAGVVSTETQTSLPLAKALDYMSLGVTIGERQPFQVSTAGGSAFASTSQESSGGYQQAAERFRRSWVRQQLEMEERGEVSIVTWQMLQEKIKSHLDVSIAAAAPPLPRQGSPDSSSLADNEQGETGAMLSNQRSQAKASERSTTAALAVDRVASRLQEADPRGTGWLPFRVTQGVLRDEIQLSFSTSEAEVVTACLRSGAPRGVSDNDCRNQGQFLQGGDVFYPPLVDVLRASSFPFVNQHKSRANNWSLSPTPASFMEFLCTCLEPDPARRPSPGNILHIPFFCRDGDNITYNQQNDGDLTAAAAYLRGSGNDCSPTLALRKLVERPIQAVEKALFGLNAASYQSGSTETALPVQSSFAARSSSRDSGLSTRFGAETLAEALKELECILHRKASHQLAEDSQEVRRTVHGHARVVDKIFESGVLMRASTLALRFLDQEEVCGRMPEWT